MVIDGEMERRLKKCRRKKRGWWILICGVCLYRMRRKVSREDRFGILGDVWGMFVIVKEV